MMKALNTIKTLKIEISNYTQEGVSTSSQEEEKKELEEEEKRIAAEKERVRLEEEAKNKFPTCRDIGSLLNARLSSDIRSLSVSVQRKMTLTNAAKAAALSAATTTPAAAKKSENALRAASSASLPVVRFQILGSGGACLAASSLRPKTSSGSASQNSSRAGSPRASRDATRLHADAASPTATEAPQMMMRNKDMIREMSIR
jgi:hypothetical protein